MKFRDVLAVYRYERNLKMCERVVNCLLVYHIYDVPLASSLPLLQRRLYGETKDIKCFETNKRKEEESEIQIES